MKYHFLIFAALALLTSCSDEETGPDGCPSFNICSTEFKSISIELVDLQGKPYLLDEYYIKNVSTGEKLIPKYPNMDSAPKELGFYHILDDNDTRETTKSGVDFQFTGLKAGTIKFQKTIKIAHDCCHVLSKSDSLKFVIID